LTQKGASYKSKFETDQRNGETEIAKKRVTEEEEHKEAVKYRKVVADSSIELVAALKQFAPPPHSEIVKCNHGKKNSTMKTQIMQEIGEKMESSNG
jgi:hypothetical protein